MVHRENCVQTVALKMTSLRLEELSDLRRSFFILFSDSNLEYWSEKMMEVEY